MRQEAWRRVVYRTRSQRLKFKRLGLALQEHTFSRTLCSPCWMLRSKANKMLIWGVCTKSKDAWVQWCQENKEGSIFQEGVDQIRILLTSWTTPSTTC